MIKRLLVAVWLMAAAPACGTPFGDKVEEMWNYTPPPRSKANLTIENEFFEAAFDVYRSGGSLTAIISNHRVRSGASATFPDAIEVYPELGVHLQVDMYSLGEMHSTDVDTDMQVGRTLHLICDYDAVDLHLRVTPQWEQD